MNPLAANPKISRRKFLQRAAHATALAAVCAPLRSQERVHSGQVMTVLGPVDSDRLGVTLPHEHVLVDFIGASQVSRDRYDAEEVFQVALPFLKKVRALGCRTLVECTPAFLGRDPLLLRRLAQASDVRLVTNTGYYGAGGNKFLPEHARRESAEELAARWIAEWRGGIEGTGIRPGIIKIGVGSGRLSDLHRKLVRAAAKTHRQSGLAIAAHTGDGVAALDELETLKAESVDASAFIWVHAQNESDASMHARAAEQGAWVEFDGIAPSNVPEYTSRVLAMRERGLLHRVLLSQDAGWYHVGEPDGGQFRSYETLLAEFKPALESAGLSRKEIDQLVVENPARALAIRSAQ